MSSPYPIYPPPPLPPFEPWRRVARAGEQQVLPPTATTPNDAEKQFRNRLVALDATPSSRPLPWKTTGDWVGGLSPSVWFRAFPEHVKEAMRKRNVRVRSEPFVKNDDAMSAAGYYDRNNREVVVTKEYPFSGGPMVRPDAGSVDTQLRFGATAMHEVGHAIDGIMEELKNGLTYSDRLFTNICRKHQAGTPGGGGGHGEFAGDYVKSSCEELYASGLEAYYRAPQSLREYDPVMYDFFSRVDGALRAYKARNQAVPPMIQR